MVYYYCLYFIALVFIYTILMFPPPSNIAFIQEIITKDKSVHLGMGRKGKKRSEGKRRGQGGKGRRGPTKGCTKREGRG